MAWLFLSMVVAVACGETRRTGANPQGGSASTIPGDARNGGAGARSSAGPSNTAGSRDRGELGEGGTAVGELGEGGTAVGELGEGGTAVGELGEGGAGARGITSDEYSFLIVPGVPPAVPPQGWSAKDLADVGTWASSVSEDGALLAGISTWRYRDPKGFEKRGERLFFWTEAAGSKPLPFEGKQVLVAPNGTAIFGAQAERMGVAWRWTTSEGSQVLTAEGRPESVYLTACSPDGNVLLGVALAHGRDTPLIWRRGVADDQLVPIPPGPLARIDYARLSPDGSLLIVEGKTEQGLAAVATWAIGPGPISLTQLVSPLGQDCFTYISNFHGSVLAGMCKQPNDITDASAQMFRYRAGDAALQLIADGPTRPSHISADGTTIVGTDGYGTAIWWTPAGSVKTKGNWVVALTEDAATAWVARFDGSPGLERAARWTRADGAMPVELLPGSNESRVTGVTQRGAVFVGTVGTYPDLRAMLWDEHGIRDISQELMAAGVDLQGAHLHDALLVWETESTIRVLGSATIEGQVDQHHTWIATLPQR